MTDTKAPLEPPARKAARAYMKQGYAPIPLPARSKNPDRKGWQNERHGIEDLSRIWKNGQGVGLLLGEPSGGLVDVDLDVPEAVRLGGRFLPPARTSGREGIRDSHWWYRAPGSKTAKFADIGVAGEMLVELRSTGCQTVVEPSIHPEGDRYLWSRSGLQVARIEAGELLDSCRRLAAAVLIARHLPASGRHDFALALVGYLLRNGLDEETVLKILIAAWNVNDAPDEGLQDLRGIVRDTRARLDRDEPVKGGRTLDGLVGGMPKALASFMGWERADVRERPKTYTLSDVGNAERFVDMHGGRVRWCPQWKSFAVYDGKRWRRDEYGVAVKHAHETARAIHRDAAREPDTSKQREISRFAVSSQNESRVRGMLSQVKPYLGVGIEDLDRNPWAINCLNGTMDLKTAALRPHDPRDHVTKLAPVEYNPNTRCPLFEKFLEEVLVDADLIGFVQRFAGYSLTGDTRERCIAILHGGGTNGKSTLVEILQDAMGEYAMNTDTETILAKKYQGVGNDVAALKGARFVSAAEVEKGRRLAESKVKQLTGSDTVTARYLFGEPFNFRPEFKLWLSTNNKPQITGTDDAIWNRIRLVPFDQCFKGREDKELPSKLREELPGIFAWMVRGCLEWQARGLGEPEGVRNATKQYREDMDKLAAFFEERCVVHPGASVPATVLYAEYGDWCRESGEDAEVQRVFGMSLADRGFASKKITSGSHKDRKEWLGIGLKAGPDGGGEDPDGGADDGPLGGGGADHRADEASPKHAKQPNDVPDGGFYGPLADDRADHRPL